MTTKIKIRAPKPHPAQQHILDNANRFNVVPCGRRFGKTKLGVYLAMHTALDGDPVLWFTPQYKFLIEAWQEIRQRLTPVISSVRGAPEYRMELVTGGTIEMWTTTSENAGRSRKGGRAIIDEAGLETNMQEVWMAAIRPALTDLKGDAWFLGTPKGRNYFWLLYERGNDVHHPHWRSFRHPSTDNPYLDPDEIEAARLDTPERIFMQEYLAEFIEDGPGVFRRVRESATAEWQNEPIPGHSYAIGVDWGKHEDFTVITVIDTSTHSVCYLDRFNQIDYRVQTARLGAVSDTFSPDVIVAERNSMGEPLIESLQNAGYPVHPFTTTNQSKARIIEGLQLAFEQRSLQIPNDETLIHELIAYESERLPSGLVRYGAPQGMHDDMVMSLALAYDATVSGTLMVAVVG